MTTWQPAIARVAVVRFAPSTVAVPVVRARTVQTLNEWSVDGEAVQVAELVVSELATNAVRASHPDDEFIAVRLSISSGSVVVEVWSRPDATEPQVQHPDADSETGRGLALVEALTSRWDAYRARSGGVVVWAQFPGSVLPAQRASSEVPMPKRTPTEIAETMPVTYPSAIHFSTEPEVLARVADRLRALDPWHERPTRQPC
jgi:anti-sigma regulatory factor (Ser/Thr protein kinase)